MRPPKLPQYLDISKERLPKLPLSPSWIPAGSHQSCFYGLDIFKGSRQGRAVRGLGISNFVPTSSPLPPYSPQVQEGHVNSYFGKCRRRRSYGSSNGPKRRHGDRRVRSYGDRIVHNNGGGRVYSYGTRRGYRKENRNVRSYGDRRVYSYGERQGFSYGDRYRRWCLYDRKGSPSSNPATARAKAESGLERVSQRPISSWTASRVGAFWVAGHFLTTFTRNLNFNNLPEILKVKYQWAGNEN